MIGSMPISRGARWPIGKNCTNSMSISVGAGAQRQRIAVAAHVGRGAVAAIKPRQAAGRQDRRLGGDRDRRAGAEMIGRPRRRLRRRCVTRSTMQRSPALRMPRIARHRGAQRLRHRRAGVDEIDIDAARPVMARRHGRGDVAVLARPADAPFVQLADAVRPLLAEQARQRLVAQAAAGGERVVVDGDASRPAFLRRARPRPSSAPSRWRRRARSGCGRPAARCAPPRAASIAAYMPAAPAPMTSTSVSIAMCSGGISDSSSRKIECRSSPRKRGPRTLCFRACKLDSRFRGNERKKPAVLRPAAACPWSPAGTARRRSRECRSTK